MLADAGGRPRGEIDAFEAERRPVAVVGLLEPAGVRRCRPQALLGGPGLGEPEAAPARPVGADAGHVGLGQPPLPLVGGPFGERRLDFGGEGVVVFPARVSGFEAHVPR